jgi:transposase-like protein
MTQPTREQVRAKWQSLVSEQQESGQSMAAFCRGRELHKSQFYYWKKRLREAATPQFVEVRVAKPPLSQRDSCSALGSTIEVRLSNGRSLVVAPSFDASHLRALLAVVESES